MKKYALLFCFLLSVAVLSARQRNVAYINPDSVRQQFHLAVMDVVKHTAITHFSITVYVGYDTLRHDVQSAEKFGLALYPGMLYKMMIAKPGFDTLYTEWRQPADTADVYVDFYMRKNGMTKAERKEAYKQSRNALIRVTPRSGGFRNLGVDRRHMCECHVDIYTRSFSEGFWVQVE
jgi:hypothetical protein